MFRVGLVTILATVVAWTPLDEPKNARTFVGQAELAAAIEHTAQPQRRDWDWRGRIDRGDAIEISAVNGDVHAERASGDEVEVVARMRGRESDPNEIRMEVIEHDGGVTICAVYPSDDSDRPNECRAGGRGRHNVRNNDVEVSFTVRVPAGVAFVGRSVNGDVGAYDFEADVQAHTVNGTVDVSTSGLAEATSVNGSITVSMGRADWTGSLAFSTVNGSITIEMPSDLECELSVATVNGHISSDYPLTVQGRISPRHFKGTIGDGGRSLSLKTVNGSIQLRRS